MLSTKSILVGFISYAPLAFLASIFPSFSWLACIAATSTSLVGMFAFVRTLQGGQRSKIVAGMAWPILFFLLGYRSLTAGTGPLPALLILLLLFFVGAALLPYFSNPLSRIVWQEQVDPRSKVGQFLLSLAWRGLPAIGSLGAILGLYGQRLGIASQLHRVAGGLLIIAAILLAQGVSHQLQPILEADAASRPQVG